jgi:hypothetical protein
MKRVLVEWRRGRRIVREGEPVPPWEGGRSRQKQQGTGGQAALSTPRNSRMLKPSVSVAEDGLGHVSRKSQVWTPRRADGRPR